MQRAGLYSPTPRRQNRGTKPLIPPAISPRIQTASSSPDQNQPPRSIPPRDRSASDHPEVNSPPKAAAPCSRSRQASSPAPAADTASTPRESKSAPPTVAIAHENSGISKKARARRRLLMNITIPLHIRLVHKTRPALIKLAVNIKTNAHPNRRDDNKPPKPRKNPPRPWRR